MDEIAQTLLLLDQQLLLHPEQAVALDQAVADLVDVDRRQRVPRLRLALDMGAGAVGRFAG